MRLIDAIAYRRVLEKEKRCERNGDELTGLEIAIADLGDMPTIDAVLVVRCKDCKHRGDAYVCPMCEEKGEDFCSYGERRVDECS